MLAPQPNPAFDVDLGALKGLLARPKDGRSTILTKVYSCDVTALEAHALLKELVEEGGAATRDPPVDGVDRCAAGFQVLQSSLSLITAFACVFVCVFVFVRVWL